MALGLYCADVECNILILGLLVRACAIGLEVRDDVSIVHEMFQVSELPSAVF